MGVSTSALETAKLVRTFVSDEATPAESIVQLLNTPITDDEASQVFPVEQLRRLRHLHTRNFAALLYRCIGAVAAVGAKRQHINTTSNASGTILTAQLMTQFHTALRILYHILPVALEGGSTALDHAAEGESLQGKDPATETADGVRMTETSRRHRTNATQNFQELFFVRGSTCDDDRPDEMFPIMPRQYIHFAPAHPYAKPLPLGSFLVWSLVECCFIRGLTLPEQAVQPAEPQLSVIHAEVDTGIMWCAGLASEDPIQAFASSTGGPSFSWAAPRLPAMRKRLLDILFIALSSCIYHHIGFRDTIFLEPILSTTSVPLMPTLAISMLNTILHFVPYGYLPYTSHLGVEERELVEACARVLDATLSYVGIPLESLPTPRDTQHGDANGDSSGSPPGGPRGNSVCLRESKEEASEEAARGPLRSHPGSQHSLEDPAASGPCLLQASPGTQQTEPANQHSDNGSAPAQSPTQGAPPRFVHSVRKAIRDITITEAKVVVERMQAILGVNAYANQTYLPTSQNRLESLDEFMLLFWRIIDLSPTCLAQFGSSPHALDYVVPILDYALEVRRSSLYVYRFQLMLFVLTRLSEVRGFVLQCNQVSTAALPFRFPKLPPNHTYNDLIVLALCIVMEMKDVATLTPLFTSCTVVLANMAPFMTSLGRTPSIKLVSIFAHAAYRCLRKGSLAQTSPNRAVDSRASAPSLSNAPEAPMDLLYQSMMINLCEAIASLLQYQPSSSLYVLASLVDHRAVVREVREAYSAHCTGVLAGDSPLPFLIKTLDSAVSVALPVVESTDALRKISKYYMDITSPEVINNATAALERTSAFVPPVWMGKEGVGLAASDVAIGRLRALTLVGVLPTPHSIVTRKFQSTKSIEHWALATFWTSAYIHSVHGTLGDRDSAKLVAFVGGRTAG
ncbi:hypothetical protein ABL78_7438 [Leptomonas seymouri]|uniref:High-temperature-induced dauer-formation protein n=1 Tax=Leptomonas seymouri TaxID=5684 RepID=A0A0N1PB93_LEPSE|nr:hypothetical protein ABL78_7438 [Leptomonas seymouri]|eukprot:KPI83522.1 hypothetical protein ABL78_7438 [Leptomonas seymouri]